jgi:hypothetical protein
MRIASLITTLGVVLLGTIGFAQTVTYDFDRTANFRGYRTYAWTSGTALRDELNHARVVRAIESQMALKGFTRVESSAHPDVLIAYHASFDRNLLISADSSGWAGPRFGGFRSGTATTQQILTGTLVVDMIEAASQRMVWRGIASADVDPSAKPEKREKSINKAAQKIFKHYPSQS